MFEQLLARAPMPVYVYDAEDRFVFVNTPFERLFDRPSSDFIGRHISEVFDEDIATPLLVNNARVREKGPSRFREQVPTAVAGETRTYATEKFPLPDGGVAGVSIDVTREVIAERELRERQTVLDAVTRQSADMLTLHDLPSGRVRWASAGSAEVLGYRPDELVGTMPAQWLVLDDPAGLLAQLGEAAKAGRSMLVRREARTASGETRWVEVNTQATDVDPDTGEPRAAVAIIRDITARQSEYERLQSEVEQRRTDLQLMHHVLEAIADPIAIEDLDTGEVVFTNSPMAEALTSAPDEGWHQGDLARHVREELDGDDITTVRSEFRHRDGRGFPVEILVQRLEHGGRQLALGVARDITDLVEQHEQTERRERQFRTLAEESDGMVYRLHFTPEFEFDYLNDRAVEITGYAVETLLADPGLLYRRVHEEDRGRLGFDPTTEQQATSTERRVTNFRFQRADGTWIWLEDHHAPELDEAGEVVGHQGIAFDVTARREHQEARAAALEHERAAAQQLRRTMDAHDAFLRNISHELRTPLTTVIGFARTLRSHLDALPAQQRRHLLDRLVSNAERLADLLEQLLDLDRLTRGGMHLDLRQGVDLGSLCAVVVDDVAAPRHRLQLEVASVEATIDRPKIERVVDHLVRNAVRHTPPGTTITVALAAHAGDVELTVADDGPGVPPEVAGRVFDPFQQGEQAAGEASPGTGIGLALVRAFVELHDGHVRYEGRQPVGSRFVVTLPRAGPPDAAAS